MNEQARPGRLLEQAKQMQERIDQIQNGLERPALRGHQRRRHGARHRDGRAARPRRSRSRTPSSSRATRTMIQDLAAAAVNAAIVKAQEGANECSSCRHAATPDARQPGSLTWRAPPRRDRPAGRQPAAPARHRREIRHAPRLLPALRAGAQVARSSPTRSCVSRRRSCSARSASTSPTARPCASVPRPAARRGRSLCVVEEPADLAAIERSGGFRGLYHVLGGALSPIDGIGPEELRDRASSSGGSRGGGVREVILATNPTAEGDATAHYLADRLRGRGRAPHAHRLRHAPRRRPRVRRPRHDRPLAPESPRARVRAPDERA